MKADLSLEVKTKGADAIEKLNRQVRALEASLKSITSQMQSAAKAAATSSGSRPSQGQKANQSKTGSDAKRSAADLYTFRSRLEAQRQRESARNEAFLHRLRQSSFRQAERDQAKAIRDRVAGEARIAREAKSAEVAAARAASAEMRAIRERIQFGVRTSAQRVREQAATERARAGQAAAIVREQRQTAREEAKALRDRLNFVARMASQRAHEESASERDRQAALRESIRMDRYRMSLRDREERRLHRESTARDQERDRLRGSAISNARSAVQHSSEGFNRTTRTIAGAGAVAAGAGALATRTGIGARMEVDTAETNLKIFAEQTQEQIRAARRGWLDREAIKNGLGIAGGINAYGEVLKSGMKSPVENAKSIMGAVSALELDLKDTTKLAGLIDRNYGAESTPQKLKSALNAIAIAAREDPTQAPEIVAGMKRGFGVLSMGNMKPEELAALVSGGQSVGIEPGKAGTFIATLGKQLSSGANRFLDPKNRKELNFAASRLGFGNARNMASQFRDDSAGTILKTLERLKEMDATMRTTVASALSGNQWNDEDLQMVNGLDGLKNTLAAVRDPSNSGFLDDAARKRQTSWLGQWNSTKAIFTRFWESFGAGFDEILQAVNDYFLNLHGRFDFDQVTDIVKQGLEGVKEALGVKTWRDLLSGMFGGNLAGVGQEVRSFARGFSAGVMEIIGGIKSVIVAFAGSKASTEQIAWWTGRLVAFAAACVIAAPAIAVLSGLAGVIAALATAAIGAWKLLQAAGLVGAAGATAGRLGALARGAGPVGVAGAVGAGRGEISTFILRHTLPEGWQKAVGLDKDAPETKPDDRTWSRSILEALDPGLARFILGDGTKTKASEPAWIDPPAKTAAERIIAPKPELTKPAAPVARPVEAMRKPVEDLKESIDRNTLIQKQSFEANDNFAGLIRKANFTTSNTGRIVRATIQGQGADLRSAVLAGSSGSVGSVGGGPLSGSTPGSALGNTGISGRGIIGGGQTSPGLGAGSGSSADAASSGPAVPGDRRMGGSRSWRNNNPGNIEYGAFARSMGATGTDGRFAVFPDYKAGRNAQEKLLFEGQNYKNLTLAQAIRRWAPASENNVPAYIKAMGADPNTRMQDFSPSQRSTLLDAMQRHEGWKPGQVVAGPSQPVGGANGQVMGGTVDSANKLVGVASQYIGLGEGRGRDTLENFMGSGSIVGSANAWCARFVNASLKAVGDSGTRSGIANSFLRWGKAVEAEAVKAGDIAVEHRGRGVDGRGGHVGIATGKTRIGRNGQLQLELIEGNSSNQVKRDWTAQVANEAKASAEHYQEMFKSKAEIEADSLKSVQDAGRNIVGIGKAKTPNVDALTSRDWMRKISGGIPLGQVLKTGPGGFGRDADGNITMPDARSAAEFLTKPRFNGVGAGDAGTLGTNLGSKAPLGSTAPISPARSGQGGGNITTTNAPVIHVNGANQSPEQIAAAVERKLSQNMNRRTHDLDPGSISGIG